MIFGTFSFQVLSERYDDMTRGSLRLAEGGHGIAGGTMTMVEDPTMMTTNQKGACCGVWYGCEEDTIQSEGREIARVIYCFCTPEMEKRRRSWHKMNKNEPEVAARKVGTLGKQSSKLTKRAA